MDQRETNVWKTTFLGSVVLRGRGGSPTWEYWFDDHQRLVEERILVLSIRCLGRAENLPFQVEVILKLRAAGLVQRRNLSSHGEKINLQISGLITAFNYLERLPGEGRIQHERNSFHLGVNVQRSGGVRRRFGCGPFRGNLVRHPQLLVVMIGRIRWHRLKSDATESKKSLINCKTLGTRHAWTRADSSSLLRSKKKLASIAKVNKLARYSLDRVDSLGRLESSNLRWYARDRWCSGGTGRRVGRGGLLVMFCSRSECRWFRWKKAKRVGLISYDFRFYIITSVVFYATALTLERIVHSFWEMERSERTARN